MLFITGFRIYLHEGEDCSFQLMYKDSKGIIKNFHATDILTLIIKDLRRQVLTTKTAEYILLEGEESAVFNFDSSDSTVIPQGDYFYDILLETEIGSTYTLIDNAHFNVLECKNPYPNPLGNEFDPKRLLSADTSSLYLCSTPLVCSFEYVQLPKKEVDGTLVLFDKVVKGDVSEDTGSEDDTLILFSETHGSPNKDEGTLIIF